MVEDMTSRMKIATLIVHLTFALGKQEFLPPDTLYQFATDVAKSWESENVILVDMFSHFDDASSIKTLQLIESSPEISFNYLSSENAIKSSEYIVNIMSMKATVTIINNDDPEYFNIFSSGRLESSIWFIPHTMNISNCALRLDSNLYLFSKLENSSISLSEVYSIKGGPKIKQLVGSWDPSRGIQISEPSPWERRRNLSGIIIYDSVIILNGYPVIVANQGDNATTDVTGYFPEILDLLSQIMGFKVIHVVPADGLFGSKNEDGTWNGMVGMLQKREADVCTCGLTITLEREEVIDFMLPLFEESITFLLMNPSAKGTVNIWAYLKTFTLQSWIGIFVTLVVFTLALTTYGKCMFAVFHEPNKFIFEASIGFMLTTFLQRGQYLLCKRNSIHMLFLVVAVFCYLIFTYFSTILTSFMTILEPSVQINSFYDILKYDFHMMTLKGSSIETFLEGTQPPSVFYDIYTKDMKGRQSAFLSSFPDVIKALHDDPKTGLFGPSSVTYSMPGLVELKLPESLSSYDSFGLQNNSEFKKMFDHHLLKMSQSGVISRVYNKWFNSTSYKTSPDDSEIIVLGYDNLIFPCLVLIVGIVLALALALAENVLNAMRYKRKWRNRFIITLSRLNIFVVRILKYWR